MELLQQLSGFRYSYHYNYGVNSDLEEFMEAFSIMSAVLIPTLIISGLLGLALYVLRSLGLMALGKNRGLSSPWIGWIPFCSGYALGRLSDDISAKKGVKTSHRKILLSMEIITAVSMTIAMVLVFAPLVNVFIQAADSAYHDAYFDSDALAAQLIGSMIGGMVLMFVGLVIAIVYSVFLYIAMYRVFKAYAPNNAVLYLVLSIFISICYPIFIFIIRNKQEVIPPTYYPPYGYNNSYQTYTPNGQQYNNQYQQNRYQQPNQQYQQPGGYQTYQPQQPTAPQQPDPNQGEQNQ